MRVHCWLQIRSYSLEFVPSHTTNRLPYYQAFPVFDHWQYAKTEGEVLVKIYHMISKVLDRGNIHICIHISSYREAIVKQETLLGLTSKHTQV